MSQWMLVLRWTTFVCLAQMLTGCGDDSFSLELSASLDGGKSASGRISWVCRYKENHSPVNMGPSIWTGVEPNPIPIIYLDVADGRTLAVQAPSMPRNKHCKAPAERDWSALLLDRRGALPQMSVLVSDPSYKLPLGVARFAMKTRSTAFSGVSQADGAAYAKFWTGIKVVNTVVATYISLPTTESSRNDSDMSPTAIAALNALPKDKPTVLQPEWTSSQSIDPSQTDLPKSLNGLPDTNVAHKYFFGPRKYLSFPNRGSTIAFDPATKPDGGEMRNIFLGLTDDVPMLSVPGVSRLVPVAPMTGIWFPDQSRLVLFVWADVKKELMNSKAIQ